EMIDKVHLNAEDGRMVTVESLPGVLERTAAGDVVHKPSGFPCPHTAPGATGGVLQGLMPGMITIFDDAKVASDFGCGMIDRGVNIPTFVFKRAGSAASVAEEEAAASRQDNPPSSKAATPLTAQELGISAGTPFAADAWIDTEDRLQTV